MKNNIKLNADSVKKLANNTELKSLYTDLIKTKAYLETITPTVVKVYNNILEKYSFSENLRRGKAGDKITDYDRLYLTDDNTDNYYAEVNKALQETGLCKNLEDGHCPECVVEHDIVKIENHIVEIVSKAFDFPEIYNMEHRKKILDLTGSFICV